MKKLLPVVVLFWLVASAGAAKRVVVTALPEPVRAFAEAETNVAFAVGAVTNGTWKLSVELDASASNCGRRNLRRNLLPSHIHLFLL